MPWSALPEHLNSPEKWKGTDWDNPFQKWILKFKGWFAYGPRAKEKWARWREMPIPLISLGCNRTVYTDNMMPEIVENKGCWNIFNYHELTSRLYYPAIIQYWSRWSFMISWPFHVHFHIFWKKKDVPIWPEKRDYSIKEMVFFRFGARRDSDVVFWFPSLFIGGDFV